MTKDLELLTQIAAGGAFDQTTAMRALARVVTANTATKQAPTATMDAPEAAVLEPDDTAARRRKVKPEATA